MTGVTEDILDRAITGRLLGSLSAGPASPPWEIRFLVRGTEADGLWVHPTDESAKHSLDPIIERGSPVEISFGMDHHRYAAKSQIIRRDRHFWFTEELMFSAILLRGPIEFKPTERRAHARFRVPDGTSTFAQITCGGALFPLRVRPWDVSAGGISFLCPRDSSVLKLRRDDGLNFVISYRGRTIAGGGVARFTRMLTERVVKIGLQFQPGTIDTLSSDNLRYLLEDVARLERARH